MILSEFGVLPDEVDWKTAKKIFQGRKIYMGIIMTAVWLVVVVLRMTVWPKLQEMHRSLGTQVSNDTGIDYPLVGLMSMSVLVVLPLFLSRWEENMEQRIQTGQIPDRVKMKEIPGRGYEPLVLLLLGLAVGYIVSTMVAPIYNLTSGM